MLTDLPCKPFAVTRDFLVKYILGHDFHFGLSGEFYSGFTRQEYYETQPSNITGMTLCETEGKYTVASLFLSF